LLSQSKGGLRNIHWTGLSQSVVLPARIHFTLREKARHRQPFRHPSDIPQFLRKTPFPLAQTPNPNTFNERRKIQGGI